MGLYILKSVLCLSVCLCFYHLVLEQEKAHKTKRYFLLASLVLSFLVPLITFTSYEYVEPISDPTTLLTLADGEDAAVNKANTSLNIILGIYCLGVAVYLIRFLINLNKIRVSILQHNTVKNNIYTAVLVLKRIVPHSFFNYIFINKDAYTTNAIPAEVFQHEEAHIKQKHSLDLLFIEVLQIIFWFNPLLYFTKKAIKAGHLVRYNKMRRNGDILQKGDIIKIPWKWISPELSLRQVVVKPPLKLNQDTSGKFYAYYQMKPGETLYTSVVIRFTGRLLNDEVNQIANKLLKLNKIPDAKLVQSQQKIIIPLEWLSEEYLGHQTKEMFSGKSSSAEINSKKKKKKTSKKPFKPFLKLYLCRPFENFQLRGFDFRFLGLLPILKF